MLLAIESMRNGMSPLEASHKYRVSSRLLYTAVKIMVERARNYFMNRELIRRNSDDNNQENIVE